MASVSVGDAPQTGSIPTTATLRLHHGGEFKILADNVRHSADRCAGGTRRCIDINLAGIDNVRSSTFGGEYGTAARPLEGGTLFVLQQRLPGCHRVHRYPNKCRLADAGDGWAARFLLGSALLRPVPHSPRRRLWHEPERVNTTSEEDDIANSHTTSRDFVSWTSTTQGSTAFNQTLSGTYAASSPLPDIRLPELWIHGELYAVDSSTALFVELDSNQVELVRFSCRRLQPVREGFSRCGAPRTVLPRAAKQQTAGQWRHAAHLLHK